MSDRIVWKNETRKIADLLPAEYNPRQLTEKQAKDLDTSLTRFNLADPIIINADNKIIGGHQRINILKQRGAVEVDVRVPSRQLTEHEEKELNLRLNKNLGEWDFDLLAGFDKEMLLDVGFTDFELLGAGIIDDISLPDHDKDGFEQITFTLTNEQAEQVRTAMNRAKDMGEFVETGNENSNGNAIARVCETFNGIS